MFSDLQYQKLFAFAFAFAPLAGRLGPGPRGTEVGGSEGQGLEFHALYINMDIDKPLQQVRSYMIDKIGFMTVPEIWI